MTGSRRTLRTVPVEFRAVRISWTPPLTLRMRAETVQWLNQFHPGDLCPRSLRSGCPQRHLLLFYWDWCSQGWTESSERGLVEASIKSPFIFSHSLFPRLLMKSSQLCLFPSPLRPLLQRLPPCLPERHCSYPLHILTPFLCLSQ